MKRVAAFFVEATRSDAFWRGWLVGTIATALLGVAMLIRALA